MNVLRKQLDESSLCPLCQAAMYNVEADLYDQEIIFFECSHCQHRIYQDQKLSCHCAKCTQKRKKMMQQTLKQEKLRKHIQNDVLLKLEELSLIHKLFLLSILDDRIVENIPHDEFIHWNQIKYHTITPNYFFQYELLKQLIDLGVLLLDENKNDTTDERYYVRLRVDGENDPSLYRITQQLRQWFYKNLSLGIPYKKTEDVRQVLMQLLYQELIQFIQMYCRTWRIQIAGHQKFERYCYQLMESLALGQIYYMAQTALEYLYQQKALQPRNEKFINTNLLKKTLEQYRERAVNEKWETSTLPRPHNLALSKMSQIFLYDFLAYDERIFIQPVWRAWRKIEPRLGFYAKKRCMHCGSEQLEVVYDAFDQVSLICHYCKHQDHYFTS